MRALIPASFLVAASLLGAEGLGAPAAERASTAAPQTVTLAAAIDQALARNLGLAVTRLEASRSLDYVDQAEAVFDPVFGWSNRLSGGKSALDTVREVAAGAKAIVALTDSGSTPLWMSRHRIHIPIYALTTRENTQRRMALYRNVHALLMDTSTDRDTALSQAEQHLKSRGIVNQGDVYAITCGEPMGSPGGTNMLKICKVA